VQARLPILIGGSGREKTLRTTARHADLWNGYGTPERVAETSEVLRQRCEEVGRDFAAIERTVTMEVVVREDEAAALEAWRPIEAIHGLAGRVGSDGSPRGLTAGGSPESVAEAVRGYEEIGISEVMWTFRHPFDLETIRRLPEVRAALAS
jgi:alkanesulfonate monooxygenase SsuD/methylene tetrahydromethanopterin reductase-like flavin-dependent oxidoreductase (luciferase family)